MSLALQLPSSLTVGPLAPYKSCVSHSCIVRTCVDRDSTTWFFVLFHLSPDSSGTTLYFRARQGHSGRHLIDPSLQDNVVIQSNFFQYIYHVGCAFNLHSIISLGLIPGGQSLSNRQSVFLQLVDPMDKIHKDPKTIDVDKQRHTQYMHKAWKRQQNAENWVDINLAIAKGLKFYQTRSNAIILQKTLPAYCFPKVVRMENWRSHIRKRIHVTSASTKDFLETRVEKRIGFRTRLTIRSWETIQKFPVSNRTNQFQNQVVIERGNPLLKRVEPKYAHLMSARVSQR